MTLIAIGIDPGYSSMGWAAVDISESGGERLLGLGVIRTMRGKGGLLRDDDHRRCAYLTRSLSDIIDASEPAIICAEALSVVSLPGGRTPISTMVRIGRVWGIIEALVELREIPLAMVSPQTIKKATVGVANASKADVRVALDACYGGDLESHLADIAAKTQHEHPVDALGAVHACLQSQHVRLLRSARRSE